VQLVRRRRTVAAGPAAAMGAVLAIVAVGPSVAVEATTTVTSTAEVEVAIPDTPAGQQLRWILDQLNGDPSALSDAAIEARFAPGFLQQVPAGEVREVLSQLAAMAPWSLVSIVEEQGDTTLGAVVRGADGAQAVTIVADPKIRSGSSGSSSSRLPRSHGTRSMPGCEISARRSIFSPPR
jgi:ORF 12 gene product N-terminal